MSGVKVYARVRPKQDWETENMSVRIEGDTIVNKTRRGDARYGFTQCYGQKATNLQCLNEIAAPMVDQVLEGFNAVMVVYGQTGSGKSFTMLGVGGEQKGLMAGALSLLLERGANLSLSAVEAYGIHQTKVPLFDLLCDKSQSEAWTDGGKWTQKKGDVTDSLKATKIPINTVDDVFKTVDLAYKASHVAMTGKNPQSSRGHTVYIAHITHMEEDGFTERKANFLFCDLAGSEGESALTEAFRAKVTAADFRRRGMEASCICTGLTDLGVIFDELRTKGKLGGATGIGLRRILRPFIGSNCVVAVM